MSIISIAVVDDSDDARETLSAELRDAQFNAKPLIGPFKSADELVGIARGEADAIVCDHHLSTRNYAYCTGAEAVAISYDVRFPAVLVTSWSKALIDDMRRFRRKIPVLLSHDEADPDVIAKGFEICIQEFSNHFLPKRRPWKTLLRVEEVDLDTKNPIVFANIPGWNPSEIIRFPMDIIPFEFRAEIKPGTRFFAKVNTGAESDEELYFDEFEFRGR